MQEEYRTLAQEMIMAGVEAADPRRAIEDNVKVENGVLWIENRDSYPLSDYEQVLLFGIGKAAAPMCQAFEEILKPDGGLAITKRGDEIGQAVVQSIPVYAAFHPQPRQENVQYSQEILDLVDSITPDQKTLVVLMISGGGSALFCAPPPGISIDAVYRLNELLMKCGANIHQINTIRKHVSQVKGGQFGHRVASKGAGLVSLILSDVVGDDLSVIASGPSFQDATTFGQAVSLLQQFGIWDETPPAIREHLQKGRQDPSMEPPRQVPSGVRNYLIGTNMAALHAAKAHAEDNGLPAVILTSQNTGEAREVAKCIMGIAKEVQDSGNPVQPPVALVIGGEMIVTFDWEDRDGFGPNREFVLQSAIEIQGRPNLVVAGADTDGVDGEGKSGAIADGHTIERSHLDPQFHLDKHEAEAFFDALEDSLEFTSSTNVNDVVVVLIGPHQS